MDHREYGNDSVPTVWANKDPERAAFLFSMRRIPEIERKNA